MNRCARLGLALLLAAGPLAASAQDGQTLQRNFPKTTLRGGIVFGTPPAILLNGVDTRTAPSVRIHGVDNLLVLSGRLVGSKAVVDYATDAQGAVSEIWILSAAEAARKPWPTTAADAAAWSFDPIAQAWTKP
jgi:hypothetical protein